MNKDLRPPAFLWCEVVRIIATAGDETYGDGELVKADGLVGEEVTVFDASPSPDRQGWLIEVAVPARREILDEHADASVVLIAAGEDYGPVWENVWFREEMLESTGLIREWDEDGYRDVPLDRENELGWRDTVKLELETYASDEAQAEAIEARAESALRALVDIDRITWTPFLNEEDEATEISASLEPSSDVLEAYERIIATPALAWVHGEDEKGFLCSRWQLPLAVEAIFLDPEITRATVICEHWSSPNRLQRHTTNVAASEPPNVEVPERWELISFFEVEPDAQDPEEAEFFGSVTFTRDVGGGDVLQCYIAVGGGHVLQDDIGPRFGDFRLALSRGGTQQIILQARDLTTVRVEHLDGAETLVALFGRHPKIEEARLTLKPTFRLEWGSTFHG